MMQFVMTATVLAIGLVFIGTNPSAAADTGLKNLLIDRTDETCTVVTEETSLNVRTYDGKISGKLKKGATVVVTEWTRDGRAKVSERRNGKLVVLGWVSGDYLSCSGGTSSSAKNFLITEDSVGDIRLGMTIAQARKIFTAAKFTNEADSGEGTVVVVRQGGKELMSLRTDQEDATDGAPVSAKAKIEGIEIADERYNTAEGVCPGMKISEVENAFGKLKEIIFFGLDATEHATFADQPKNYSFMVNLPEVSADDGRAGIYAGDEVTTTRYDSSAVVSVITVSTFVESGP